jgi:ABC-type transport system substrate-binding protein
VLIAVVVFVVALGGGAFIVLGDGSDDITIPDSPVAGGTLRLGLERPRSLDPALADRGLQAELVAADLLFDGLTALDPETLEPVPAVAGEWTTNDTKNVWNFTIAEGRTFHNGRAITAEDVKFSLERVAKRGPSSTASVQLELVAGYRAFAVDAAADNLDGVKVLEDGRLQVRLNRPFSTLPLLLASPVYGVVPPEALGAEGESSFEEPVGSGPFRIESRTDDALMLAAAAGADTYVDAIEVDLLDDPIDGYEAFADGSLDVVRVPAERVGDARARFSDEHFRPYGAELFYAFNMRMEKFAPISFRRAILRAIDRDAIVTDVYGGTVTRLDGVIPAGIPGQQDGVCGGACEHDPERAEALLEEAWPEGNIPTVSIDFDEGAPQDAIAERISEDLEDVGIPTALRPRPFETSGGEDEGEVDYQTFVASGEQQLFRLGWIGAYPSPEAYLSPLFTSNAPDNVIGFSNETVDQLLNDARATLDRDARLDLYRQAEREVMGRVLIIPLVQFQTHMVVSPRVQGLQVSVAGTFDSSAVWLADAGGDGDE